jgi:pSer/pThr/pTyr-binding forkhead associated (FHA) protein
MARLVRKLPNGETEIFELKLGVNRFGRHPDIDFCINDTTISTTHAEFILNANGVTVRDCGSTNGTFVNEQLTKEAILVEGQIVRLGDVSLLVESLEIRVAIPEYERPRPAPPVVLPDGSILCKRHPQSRATHRCTFCKEILCDVCVTRLRRKGGKTLKLCSQCSHSVEPLGPVKKKKRSFLSMLNTTIHLPLMRKKDNRDEEGD